MKDQEYFANYGYQLKVGHGPRWYRRLFRQYAKENPTQNNLLRLDELNKAEKNEAYNLTDTSGNTLQLMLQCYVYITYIFQSYLYIPNQIQSNNL